MNLRKLQQKQSMAIGIETTQNVILKHNVANVGERIVASIIDLMVLFAYFIVVMFIISGTKIQDPSLFLIISLPAIFYSFLCESFFNGQSFGKMLMNLRVVKQDGSAASIGAFFIRWIFRLIEIGFSVGTVAIVVIVSSKKGQRLGDILAGTIVVNLKKRNYFQDSIHFDLPDNYTVTYPAAKMLSDGEINTINEVLNHYKKVNNQTSRKLAERLVNELEKKLMIRVEQTPLQFMTTILKDYNFLNKE